MTIRRIILYSLIVPIAVLILLVLFETTQYSDPIGWDGFGFCCLVAFICGIIGFFISLAFSRISNNPTKKQLLFLGGQIAVMLGLIVYFFVERWRNAETNSEHNYHFVEQCPGEAKMEFKALRKLESTFKTPNNFRLQSFYLNQKDTVAGKDSSVIYYLYFGYKLDDNQDYFTKFRALKDSVDIEVLNGDPKDIPNNIKRLPESVKKFLDSGIQKLPESQREKINKELKNLEE